MGTVNDREELLLEFLDSLEGSTVVVEGRKDLKALTEAGVDPKTVVMLNKGLSLLETVEALTGDKQVVLLTDMDGEGKRLRRRLLTMFGQYGIQENKRPRELFARLRLSQVEGL